MRLWVDKSGWTLSDHGLRQAIRSGTTILKGPPMRCDREEEVFAAVGVPFREPCDRNLEPIENKLPTGPVPRRPPPLRDGVAGTQDAADDVEDDAVLIELQALNA